MKTDIYSKIVLTVIAASLVVIALQNTNFFSEANASKTNNGLATVPLNPDGSINIKMMENLKVDISAIGGYPIYESVLPVNFEKTDGQNVNNNYGIPVNIKAINGSSIYDALPVREKK